MVAQPLSLYGSLWPPGRRCVGNRGHKNFAAWRPTETVHWTLMATQAGCPTTASCISWGILHESVEVCGSVIRRVNFRWLQRFLWASDKSDPGKRPALSLQKIRIPSSAITASSLSSCYWHHGIEILAMEDRSISDHADSVWPADVWTSAIYPMATAMAIQVPRSSVVRQLAVATIHIS